ncbi:MAG TPA: hypothetical protein VKR52_06775 [Terracidiphilus sp.]|nr:hypothetical protein [Terracidiphilus sp.]
MQDPQQLHNIMAAILGFYAVMYLFTAIVFIVPSWFICKKAGFTPWLSLLCLFPLTGVVLLYILAFAEWKPMQAPVAQAAFPYPPAPPRV